MGFLQLSMRGPAFTMNHSELFVIDGQKDGFPVPIRREALIGQQKKAKLSLIAHAVN